MSAALIAVLSLIAYVIAYRTYGRFLGSRILGFVADRPTPAVEKSDGIFIAVVAVGFAMTTLDSGTRLLRYNLEELGSHFRPLGRLTRHRFLSASLAVLAIGYFALIKVGGKPAGITLWELFGISKQLLGALGFLVMTLWFYRRGKPVIYFLLPMIFMSVITLVALPYSLLNFLQADPPSWPLIGTGLAILILDLWLIGEAIASWRKIRMEKENLHA